MARLPRSLQTVLWSTNIDLLDTQKDKWYIIHHVLIYGDMKNIRWLFRTYSETEIVDVFVHHPAKLYPKEMFHFVKNFLLPLKNASLDQDNYVTSIYGPIRQRAAAGI